MKWEVKPPPYATDAMIGTLERRGITRVTGWAKREHGAYTFNVSSDESHPGREITIGPRGGIHSDTQVDFERKRAQRERRKSRPTRERSFDDIAVYSKDGDLIGLRLW